MSNVPKLRFKEFSGEWEVKKLEKLCSKISDGIHSTPVYDEDGEYYFVNGNNLKNGVIVLDDKTKRVSKDEFQKHYRELNDNTILMSINGTIGNTAFYNDEKVMLGKSASYINIDSSKTNKYFISNQLSSNKIQYYYTSELTGSTIKNLSLKAIKNTPIILPSKQEQEKIASFLTSVDTKIEQLTKKEELLKQYKKGVMQQIFSGEIRFKADDGSEFEDWEETSLRKIFKERKLSATKADGYEHISLTTDGVVPKSERYERDFLVSDDSVKKYKVTKLDDICYNPANLKFGVISRNKYSDGIFSPIYVTFEVVNADINFIEYFVTRWDFINRVRKYEEGTVYERQAVKPEDFLKFSIAIPPLEEQTKIANFLSSIDSKIEQVSAQLDSTKEFKKALLQQMFV